MFKKNVGQMDRLLRVIVGLGLLIAFFVTPGGSYSWLYLIGIVPLATGLMGSCGLYTLLGVSTCKIDQK